MTIFKLVLTVHQNEIIASETLSKGYGIFNNFWRVKCEGKPICVLKLVHGAMNQSFMAAVKCKIPCHLSASCAALILGESKINNSSQWPRIKYKSWNAIKILLYKFIAFQFSR